jgi:hypothetical protein
LKPEGNTEEIYGMMLLAAPYTVWMSGSKVTCYKRGGQHQGILFCIKYHKRGAKYVAHILTEEDMILTVDVSHVLLQNQKFLTDVEFNSLLQRVLHHRPQPLQNSKSSKKQ